MQDDVADAALWAVAQGWVDAGRICIAGGSYGGYAVLMGLVRITISTAVESTGSA
jgi:dipeptidyl aminopeptidase/acylaminoacyl peptidase